MTLQAGCVDGNVHGLGGSSPGLYTLIAAILCGLVLIMGNSSEHKQYDKVENKTLVVTRQTRKIARPMTKTLGREFVNFCRFIV